MKNGYIAFYKGNRYEIHADTLVAARDLLAQQLRIKPNQRRHINIVLAEKNGQPVTPLPLM